MSEEDTKKVITLLRILPAGVQKMSREIEGLVQTSLNLGVLESKEDGVSFCFSVRSSVESEKQELLNRLELTAQTVGAFCGGLKERIRPGNTAKIRRCERLCFGVTGNSMAENRWCRRFMQVLSVDCLRAK